MIVRTALAAASLASLSLLAPARAAACDAPAPGFAVTVAPRAPVVSLGVRWPAPPPPPFVAPPVAFAPRPVVAPAPPFAPPPTSWAPPRVFAPRAVRAACVARFGPDPWRVSRCEARWLALRPVPGPRGVAIGWRGHGHDDD